MKKKESKQKKSLTARDAAKDFIRPYILAGDTFSIRHNAQLKSSAEEYQAQIEGDHVVITRLYGKPMRTLFQLQELMKDVVTEYTHQRGIAKVRASTAEEAYFKRNMAVKLLFRQLKSKLKRHKREFKRDNTNWGYVGDIAHIQETLTDLVSFLH